MSGTQSSGAPAERKTGGREDVFKEEAGGSGAPRVRTRAMTLLALFFLLCGAAFGAYWHLVLRLEESTDNAYTTGNLVRVSPRVGGAVEALYADNNEAVRAGDVLVRLDATDAELAYRRARSALADAVRKTSSLMAESARLAALVKQREQELEKARGDYERRKNRRTAMAVSEEELSHARDDLAIAETALNVAREDMRRNDLLLRETPVEDQPPVKLAAHMLREAWLALRRCDVKSPVDGFVARRSAQLGARVEVGAPLMAVVPLHELWVEANFKEKQLERMRVGQKAVVTADMYGSAVRYEGLVSGFSAGTGSSFSLLPPENATGNWIKVVQRVPVKIVLKAEDLENNPLLVGLSCLVTVDVSDASGSMLNAPGSGREERPFLETRALEEDFAAIDKEIADIIQSNAVPLPARRGIGGGIDEGADRATDRDADRATDRDADRAVDGRVGEGFGG